MTCLFERKPKDNVFNLCCFGHQCWQFKDSIFVKVTEPWKQINVSIFLCVSVCIQVQAVLLLLGGYEIPSGIPAMGTTTPNQRVCVLYFCIWLWLNWKRILFFFCRDHISFRLWVNLQQSRFNPRELLLWIGSEKRGKSVVLIRRSVTLSAKKLRWGITLRSHPKLLSLYSMIKVQKSFLFQINNNKKL